MLARNAINACCVAHTDRQYGMSCKTWVHGSSWCCSCVPLGQSNVPCPQHHSKTQPITKVITGQPEMFGSTLATTRDAVKLSRGRKIKLTSCGSTQHMQIVHDRLLMQIVHDSVALHSTKHDLCHLGQNSHFKAALSCPLVD